MQLQHTHYYSQSMYNYQKMKNRSAKKKLQKKKFIRLLNY